MNVLSMRSRRRMAGLMATVLVACTSAPTADVPSPPGASLPPGPARWVTDAPGPKPACVAPNQELQVVVNAAGGPLGGAPAPISTKLLSMNIDDQRPYDYAPIPNPDYVAYLRALKPALLRWPSGSASQTYQFALQGSGPGLLTPTMIDAFMALCQDVGAKPLIAVNTTTGTTENAAALVQYINTTQNAQATWWQLGHEPDLNDTEAARDPNAYAATFRSFQAAMRAVDASIKFVGGEISTGACVRGSHASTDWATPMLAATASSPMDAIAWHYYPLDSSQSSTLSSATLSVAHALQESAPDWPPAGLDFASLIFPRLQSLKASYAPHAELWVDEFAEDSGVANGDGVADRFVGALWAADVLGRFAEQGADALFRFIFKAGSEHKYSLIDENYQPRPEYYSYWLYAQHFGDHMVSATSSAVARVAAHASIRKTDGTLRLVLVNKSDSFEPTAVTLAGYVPARALRYQLVASSPSATDVALNGAQLSMATVGLKEAAIPGVPTSDACVSTVLTLPPYSVTLYVYASN